MQAITATDLIDFYDNRADFLALTTDATLTHLDHSDLADIAHGDPAPVAGAHIRTTDGQEVQILLERTTITDGDWYPDALTDDGHLDPQAAADMAEIITADSGITVTRAVHQAKVTARQWIDAQAEADRLADLRARHVAEVVDILDGNQTHAARSLGLDPSTVNRLVKKIRVASRT